MGTRRSSAEWARLVREWKRSGLTAAQFGKRAGVKPRTLSWWKWRLGKGAVKRSGPERKQGAALVPVQVVQVPSDASAETSVEVVLGDVVVRVRRGFDGRTLARVLDVLEGEEC